jgi:alkylated DNA repair dioxygenase AlkB
VQQCGLDPKTLAEQLVDQIPWQQPQVKVFGRLHPVPRLTCWLGDPGLRYRYSGLVHQPHPWTPATETLRRLLAAGLGCSFNSLLLNRYRDGNDRMGWHADDEPELVAEAPIASISLGVSRSLRFRPRPGRHGQAADGEETPAPLGLELHEGDLLVMDPPTQQHWHHALPARRRLREERLNLTFRRIRIP